MNQSVPRILAILVAFVACTDAVIAQSKKHISDENNQTFHALILQKASEYKQYRLVDENLHRAPWLCALPPEIPPRPSKSADNGTHGQKLYLLYAKNIDKYLANTDAPVGQTLVKESFEASNNDANGKKTLTAGKKYGLFIMTKLAPDTPGTDKGWVYATVAADDKTITAAGRVQSCMECHVQTKYDRQFGFERKP